MEIIVKAKSVEEAVLKGATQLGKNVDEVEYTVLGEAKKGFLGMFSSEAEVKVFCNDDGNTNANDYGNSPSEADCNTDSDVLPVEKKVLEFLNKVIDDMGVEATASVSRIDERLSDNSKAYEKDIHIEITGKGLGMLIGRHGDVLDSLQYLSNIVVSRYPKRQDKHEYIRIIIDIENYRAKREEALKLLANRMASKVLASGRNFTLEPMSSYERRIIHSAVQQIKGVHTFSVGTENNRRVVIAYGEDVDNAQED